MIGTTLDGIRTHVEALASDGGSYFVRCGRTGERPVPITGLRFDGRATARSAARAAQQYRSALRRYDPRLPHHDLIVSQEGDGRTEAARRRGATAETPRQPPGSALDGTPERRDLVEFCHRVAGAVFETLSADGYDEVESDVMDAYFGLAETTGDPSELCLCLLESMAAELHGRLHVAEQAEVLADAATRLDPTERAADPVAEALSVLDSHGVIEGYARTPWSVDLDAGERSVAVQVGGYALSPRDGRLPVLPLTLELARHRSGRLPRSVAATTIDSGWRLTFRTAEADEIDRDGRVSVPIREP